jgi:hypothetical protein
MIAGVDALPAGLGGPWVGTSAAAKRRNITITIPTGVV